MPSGEHESPIELARLDPGLLVWLAEQNKIEIPQYHHIRPYATDVRVLVPHTYHADSVLLFCDELDKPLFAFVWEPHRDDNVGKVRTWKLYLAQVENELDVTTVLLVYCPNPAHARSYQRRIEADRGSIALRPVFITPDDVPPVTDIEQARANPAAAVFAALCHGRDPSIDEMFPALTEALRTVDSKTAISFYDIILAGLPMPARKRWEAYMTATVGHTYRSDLFRRLFAAGEAHGKAQGEAQGEARGEAQAILTVLDEKGIAVPADAREKILACTDLDQLTTWLRRAVRATTVDEVLAA